MQVTELLGDAEPVLFVAYDDRWRKSVALKTQDCLLQQCMLIPEIQKRLWPIGSREWPEPPAEPAA